MRCYLFGSRQHRRLRDQLPRVKLTKSVIDALPTPSKDIVHWDTGCPGFGVKITPKGRKVFVVLHRTAGAGSRLRKYTIGPYGRVTINQARVTAQKVFAAKLDGRDLAAEKKESRRRMVADRVDDLLEAFIAQHLAQNRSGPEISRMLRREIGAAWGARSIHEITKHDVIDVVSAIEQRRSACRRQQSALSGGANFLATIGFGNPAAGRS
jgi:Arm domain-containing DNA-binding protein